MTTSVLKQLDALSGLLATNGLANPSDFFLDDDLMEEWAVVEENVQGRVARRSHRTTYVRWGKIPSHIPHVDSRAYSAAANDVALNVGSPLEPSRGEGIGESVIRELARLVPGWAGPGSVAPTGKLLREILNVIVSLPFRAKHPEAEVDPDDGAVILRWDNKNKTRSFSLTFLGRGEVTGFITGEPAWKMKISDANNLTVKLSSQSISAVVTEQ